MAHSRLITLLPNPETTYHLKTPKVSNQVRLLALMEAIHWFASGFIQATMDVLIKYLLPDIVLRYNRFPSPGYVPVVKMHCSNKLGRQLTNLLKPFNDIPESSLPYDFHTGMFFYEI